ncbi:hypothetical protein ElyMa_004460800 [Elysia marginata]|uniref:BEN domain-containing protein n=1 Tax=Elysia marginata TaxID=1093978 RepID=A0AAV4HIA0_9GAST|nr:hypothetical protein ElyMa_004460800 [Elysia marginata]
MHKTIVPDGLIIPILFPSPTVVIFDRTVFYSSMEVYSVMSPPYTGFLQRFDPEIYFNKGNLPARTQVPREKDSMIADSVDDTQMLEQPNTQDYNADVSNTQMSCDDSMADIDILNVSTDFAKHCTDQRVSPLKSKLCNAVVVSDLNKVMSENQLSEEAVTEQSLVDPTKTSESLDILHLTSPSSNADVMQRYVEGRSICEASTILSVSPASVNTAATSLCVPYPVTPDISFHASNNTGDFHKLSAITLTARSHPSITANRKSSTPKIKGPVTFKDNYIATKQMKEISLRKAMFQKKISAQGSDSILNMGFTSDLASDQQNLALSPNKQQNEAGVLKKSKSKKRSIFKGLRQRIMCRKNLSLMSTLENTELEEPSCSERVKAALKPLTVKPNRFYGLSQPTIQNPMCGKTATTGTATVTFATLNETKQFVATCSPQSSTSTVFAAAPELTKFSSLQSLVTSPHTPILKDLDETLDVSSHAAAFESPAAHNLIDPNGLRNGSNRQLVVDYSCTAIPVKSASCSRNTESSPFKVPRIPQCSLTPTSSRRVRPKANLAAMKQQERCSSRTTRKEPGIRARLPSESSLSESNVTTWTTQQSFDMEVLKRSAGGVAELLTAFINDPSIAQFGAQLQDDTKSKSMLVSLCEKCEVRVKESKKDPNIFNLIKSRRSRAPTEEDVKQVVRRALYNPKPM